MCIVPGIATAPYAYKSPSLMLLASQQQLLAPRSEHRWANVSLSKLRLSFVRFRALSLAPLGSVTEGGARRIKKYTIQFNRICF